MSIEKWKSQLRKGTTELAVLLVLEKKERYGLEILEVISNTEGLAIAEGTIYPLLNRLQREGKIESRWVEEEQTSHPRKYYTLTKEGQEILEKMKVEWKEFQRSLNALNSRSDRK